MRKPDANQLLLERIMELEIECRSEKILLQEQLKLTAESLKPINLIKNALRDDDEGKNFLVDSAIGIGSGMAAKKAIVRNSDNGMLKLVGSIVQAGVTNMVSKNPGLIKSIGGSILKKLFIKKEPEKEAEEEKV